jgi:hypothetical protein
MLIPRVRGYRWSKDADTEECYTKGAGMPMPIERGCQWSKDANTDSEGMLIPRARGADTESEGMLMEQGCQYRGVLYQGIRDANATREGMPMSRGAIPMEQGCQYQW